MLESKDGIQFQIAFGCTSYGIETFVESDGRGGWPAAGCRAAGLQRPWRIGGEDGRRRVAGPEQPEMAGGWARAAARTDGEGGRRKEEGGRREIGRRGEFAGELREGEETYLQAPPPVLLASELVREVGRWLRTGTRGRASVSERFRARWLGKIPPRANTRTGLARN